MARTTEVCLWRVLGALWLLVLGGVAQAQDDPPGRVGRIVGLQGEVWLYDVEQGEWVAAQRNRPLVQGDRLSTAEAGRVELSIGSTMLLLGSNAELEALRLDDDSIQLQLHRGSLALRLRSREVAAELQVVTNEGRFLFQRSGLYRVNRRDDISDASVWRGDLSFQTDDFLLPLQAGQAAEFWQDGPQRVTRSRWLTPLNDDFALAVLQRDQADARSASARYVSPEMTGAEDLDRYGNWQEHAEYGAIWTPTVVPVGWAPYRHGHWAWLRPWGWTWVDDAAWGFAPFHYGRWLWWGGRWGWTPGPRVARPVYAPALVGWVGGGQAQFSVHVGGRPVPAVGWVPLAPREAYRPGYNSSAGYLNRINVGRPNPHGPPPTYGNRVVPGAVTVLPAQSMVPRQPVVGTALHGDTTRLPVEHFHPYAPGRPGPVPREQVSPRAASPVSVLPRSPGPVPVPAVDAAPPRRDGPNWQAGAGTAAVQAPLVPAMPRAPLVPQVPQTSTAPQVSPVPRVPQVLPAPPAPPAPPARPAPSVPAAPQVSPVPAGPQNPPQVVPNRNAMPALPGQQAGGDPRRPPTTPTGMPGAVPNTAPNALQPPNSPNVQGPQGAQNTPPRGAHRPFQPPAAPPPSPAGPPVAHQAVAPKSAQPARAETADPKAGNQESGNDKAGAPTMRTPQSRFKAREP